MYACFFAYFFYHKLVNKDLYINDGTTTNWICRCSWKFTWLLCCVSLDVILCSFVLSVVVAIGALWRLLIRTLGLRLTHMLLFRYIWSTPAITEDCSSVADSSKWTRIIRTARLGLFYKLKRGNVNTPKQNDTACLLAIHIILARQASKTLDARGKHLLYPISQCVAYHATEEQYASFSAAPMYSIRKSHR